MTVLNRKRQAVGNANRTRKLIAYWRHVHTTMVEVGCDVESARRRITRNKA